MNPHAHQLSPHEMREPALADIAGVFVRGKWTAMVIVGMTVAIGVAVGFVLPRSYRAQTLVRTALLDGQPVETVESMSTVLFTDASTRDVAAALSVPAHRIRELITIRSQGSGRFIEVIGRGSTPEAAAAASTFVSEWILDRMREAYQPRRELLDREVSTLHEEQTALTRRIAQFEAIAARLSQESTVYREEIAKRANAESDGQGRIVETYIRLLSDARLRQDQIAQDIAAAEQRFIEIDEEIQRKEIAPKYSLISPTREAAPVTSIASTLHPRFVEHLIYAGVLGVFLAIVWLLVREYHVVRVRTNA